MTAAARHVLGIDFGTSNLRLQVAHFGASGQQLGEPAVVQLPGAERGGALPTVLEFDSEGDLRAYGRPALLNLPRGGDRRFVSEFKPCIGQAEEDLQAQGRPDRARYCANPRCLHPGWAWSVAMRFCGFCGGSLGASVAEPDWRPTFAYSPDESLGYARVLLERVRRRLEAQFNEPISRGGGWRLTAGVPVHWQAGTLDRYRAMLLDAFPDAQVDLLDEPSGALRFYAAQGLLRAHEGWTLVVDFGAGTTDLVLARVGVVDDRMHADDLQVYGERYGGADFDLMLAHYAAGALGVSLEGGLLAQWKLHAREWKETFSTQVHQDSRAEATASFPVPRGGGLFEYAPVVLERRTFEQVAGDLVERFRSVVERGLKHFKVAGGEIEQVVLTGGGAHWYFVEEAVREWCPLARIVAGVEPEMSISGGLALPAPFLARQPEELELPEPAPEPIPEPVPEPIPEPIPEPVPTDEETPPGPKPRYGGRAVLDQRLASTTSFYALAYAPDGGVLVGGGTEGLTSLGPGYLQVWDARTGEIQHRGAFPAGVISLAFSPDGRRLACGTGRASLHLLTPGPWSEELALKFECGSVWGLAFLPHNDSLVTGRLNLDDRLVIEGLQVWDLTGETPNATVQALRGQHVTSVACSPDGRWIFGALQHGFVFRCVPDGTGVTYLSSLSSNPRSPLAPLFERGFGERDSLAPVVLSPDGRCVISGSSRGAIGRSGWIRFWDVESGKLQRELTGHRGWVTCAAFTPDGTLLATGSIDRTVILWNTETGRPLQTLDAGGPVLAVAISPDGERLAISAKIAVPARHPGITIWRLE